MNRAQILKIVFLFVFLGIVANTVYSATITAFPYSITVGGTYYINGTYSCTSDPCIWINTSQPVTIIGNNAYITGSGSNYFIKNDYVANLTIENLHLTYFYAIYGNVNLTTYSLNIIGVQSGVFHSIYTTTSITFHYLNITNSIIGGIGGLLSYNYKVINLTIQNSNITTLSHGTFLNTTIENSIVNGFECGSVLSTYLIKFIAVNSTITNVFHRVGGVFYVYNLTVKNIANGHPAGCYLTSSTIKLSYINDSRFYCSNANITIGSLNTTIRNTLIYSNGTGTNKTYINFTKIYNTTINVKSFDFINIIATEDNSQINNCNFNLITTLAEFNNYNYVSTCFVNNSKINVLNSNTLEFNLRNWFKISNSILIVNNLTNTIYVYTNSSLNNLTLNNVSIFVNNTTIGNLFIVNGTINFNKVNFTYNNSKILNSIFYFNNSSSNYIEYSKLCIPSNYTYYFEGTSNLYIYNDYFQPLTNNFTLIVNYPDNSYTCNGTPLFTPYFVYYIYAPANNSQINQSYFTVIVSANSFLTSCTMYVYNNTTNLTVALSPILYNYFEGTITNLTKGTYNFFVVCTDINNVVNKTEVRTVYVHPIFLNQLRLYGYLRFNDTLAPISVTPKQPYVYSLNNFPYHFTFKNYTIHINYVSIIPSKQIVFQENNLQNYYYISSLASTLILLKNNNLYQNGFSFSDNIQLQLKLANVYPLPTIPTPIVLPPLSKPYFVKSIMFQVPLPKQLKLNNLINMSFQTAYVEKLTNCEKFFVLPTRCVSATNTNATVFVLLILHNSTTNYDFARVILITSQGGDLHNIILNYIYRKLYEFVNNTFKISDFNISKELPYNSFENLNLNELLDNYNSNTSIKYIYIGFITPVEQSSPSEIVYNHIGLKQLSLPSPNYLTIQTHDVINNLVITEETVAKTYTNPPYGNIITINGETPTKSDITINDKTLYIQSQYPVKISMSYRVYGYITVPFTEIKNNTYRALIRYNYTTPFNLTNITLYELPEEPIKIFKQEWYQNGTNITWVKLWGKNITLDMTPYFELESTLNGYTYGVKNSSALFVFDPTNGAMLQHTRFGDETFNITYLTQEIPDIYIEKILYKTMANAPLQLQTLINTTAINNYTVPTNVSMILTCGNNTYYYNTTVNVSNLTVVNFDLYKYIANLTNVTCYFNVSIKPEFDKILSDNQKTFVFFITPTATGKGNITVQVFNASSNTLINGSTVYLYYLNNTLVTSQVVINNTTTFTNISYGYYYIYINQTGYEPYKKYFYLGQPNINIYAYLIPSTINKTTYSVLQICVLGKDKEPVQNQPVNIYFSNGTLYKTITVNSTGCGSTVVPANQSYIVSANVSGTIYNYTQFAYPISVKPYSEAIIQTNTVSNLVKPEVSVDYVQLLYKEGEGGAEFPVYYMLYSSIPQNITLNVTIQEYINGSWVNYKTKLVNITFTNYKQVITNMTPFKLTSTNITTFRAVVTIQTYQNDTNLSNNQMISNNATIHNFVDFAVYLINMMQNVKASQLIPLKLMLNGSMLVPCKVEIKYTYKNPYNNQTVTKTQTISIFTNNETNFTINMPYTNFVDVQAKIISCPYLSVDRNMKNNQYSVNITEIPDARIISVKAPSHVKANSNFTVTTTIVSNYPLNLIFTANNQTKMIAVNFSNNTVNTTFTAPSTTVASSETINLNISGDSNPAYNTEKVTVYVYNTKTISLIFLVVIAIFGISLLLGIIKLTTKLMIKEQDYEFITYNNRRRR